MERTYNSFVLEGLKQSGSTEERGKETVRTTLVPGGTDR